MNNVKAMLFVLVLSVSFISSAQQQGHGQGDNQQASTQRQGGHGNGDQAGGGGHGKMKMSRVRHHFARDNGIGESYKAEVNPLSLTDADMLHAKTLYQDNCATCHGDEGVGDGVRSSTMDPAPTNIAQFTKMRMAKDDYLLWTIAEGGKPVSSEMPAFKDELTTNEIWEIVSYLRTM